MQRTYYPQGRKVMSKKNKKPTLQKLNKRNWFFNYIVLFIKELKRVRWPKSRKTFRSFFLVIVFTIGFSIFAFVIATLSSYIFTQIGVKL
ncbi:unknown; predicted coding region [Mycoplasmopsis pulmonis]|uniref:Protein translocase subunit SecE n=1 Tax=Mycoplasmopsis pulmonis (strain UAB CTIP) TaxID=272635 RepID=Q98R29_MYCPU|nr:preprotein translocase subunit SecE [Mycoplasmopsis pulmonis]MDZ7293148.1 preprotein translocase subunit SecE [Mycoplasmopsis pulmonis]CAC13354.1 unknown; predicted coding region [Mycoplasmopsis pulmonis]VEU67945.1 preprotein translocase subunit SecE [Mycoplasmopsis pulmonis]